MMNLTSCYVGIKTLRIKADNDNFFVTLNLVNFPKDSTEGLRSFIRHDVNKIVTVCAENNIQYNIDCGYDTTAVIFTCKIKGVKQAQNLFNAINSYPDGVGGKQDDLRINLYHASIEPDSLLLQIKFSPGVIYAQGGSIILENSATTSVFKPSENTRFLRVINQGNKMFEYIFAYDKSDTITKPEGDGNMTVQMTYPLLPALPIVSTPPVNNIPPFDNATVIRQSSPEGFGDIFNHYWLIASGIIATLASAIAIYEFLIKKK
jgi:hypothetical protein